jgi:polyphosphate kinase 2 (PPK2 family)
MGIIGGSFNRSFVDNGGVVMALLAGSDASHLGSTLVMNFIHHFRLDLTRAQLVSPMSSSYMQWWFQRYIPGSLPSAIF